MWMSILGMDISADGFFPYFVEASVYDGTAHQDGWDGVALRRFLKDVRANYPLAGVLLVGSFPDASIVRSVFVKANAYADSPINLTSGIFRSTVTSGTSWTSGPSSSRRARKSCWATSTATGRRHRPSVTLNAYQALPLEASEEYPQDGQTLVTPHFLAKRPSRTRTCSSSTTTR